MKTIAKTFPHAESGTALHLIYDKKTKRVHLCVWESKSGRLISLSHEWMKDHMDNDKDPVPELLELYKEETEE